MPVYLYLRLGDVEVVPVKAASNLGVVVVEDTMSFKSHNTDVCKSSV